jgi:acyl-CoA synthetase (AMP-forming)/AMP-acid ligase II
MIPLLGAAGESDHALYDACSGWATYGSLRSDSEKVAGCLESEQKSLVFCFCANHVSFVPAYLGTLAAGHAIALLDPQMDEEFRHRLIGTYEPDFIFAPRDWSLDCDDWRLDGTGFGELVLWHNLKAPEGRLIHADLAILLSTSGVTGSPKMVRLSWRAIKSNAESISKALSLDPDERAITSLPFYYSYGLSVLNSHLLAGGSIAVTGQGLTSRAFWDDFRAAGCNSFAGVPYTYQMLARLDIDLLDIPSLRTLTQAGGKLHERFVISFAEKMHRRKGSFYVMYGQTEAAARISVLRPDLLPEKAGSVGLPIPGGAVDVLVDDVSVGPGCVGEIVYSGPNVMMGYATSPLDFASGDTMNGRLATGDLGYRDADGLIYITGRLKRIAKVFGLRLNLDEVEDLLRGEGTMAVIGGDDRLIVFCESGQPADFERLKSQLSDRLKIHPVAFQFCRVDRLPLHANGKINYQELSLLK